MVKLCTGKKRGFLLSHGIVDFWDARTILFAQVFPSYFFRTIGDLHGKYVHVKHGFFESRKTCTWSRFSKRHEKYEDGLQPD